MVAAAAEIKHRSLARRDELKLARIQKKLRSGLARQFPAASREDHEDWLQDAFAALERTEQRGEVVRDVEGFLFRATFRLGLAAYRDGRRRSEIAPQIELDPDRFGAQLAVADSIDHQLDASGVVEALAAKLDHLPRRARQAFVLRFGESLSIAQTATVMGVSERAVQKHLHVGVGVLEDALRDAGLLRGDTEVCARGLSEGARVLCEELSSDRRRELQRVVAEDTEAARELVALRTAGQKAAAVLPFPFAVGTVGDHLVGALVSTRDAIAGIVNQLGLVEAGSGTLSSVTAKVGTVCVVGVCAAGGAFAVSESTKQVLSTSASTDTQQRSTDTEASSQATDTTEQPTDPVATRDQADGGSSSDHSTHREHESSSHESREPSAGTTSEREFNQESGASVERTTQTTSPTEYDYQSESSWGEAAPSEAESYRGSDDVSNAGDFEHQSTPSDGDF